MTRELTAAQVADDIHREEGPDSAALLKSFRKSPTKAVRIIDQLIRHPDPVVRAWGVWAASRSLPKDTAAAFARKLLTDKDSDVRDVAVEELVEVDPASASELSGRFRKKLASDAFYEPVTAMWALATIGDKDSMPAIRANTGRWRNAIHRNTAAVVLMILEGQDEALIQRVREHDHDLMPWLSRGLRVLGTLEAKLTLEQCSSEAPDAECRNFCSNELAKFQLKR